MDRRQASAQQAVADEFIISLNIVVLRLDSEAPPIRNRLKNIDTIFHPVEFLMGLPKSKSNNKSRKLNIIIEALATDQATCTQ